MLKEATISKQKIVNTFTELSEESSLEQINTTDIIKKVSLSRPTFYYYSNQDNLVETTLSKILDKVSSILQKYMTYQKGVLTEMLRYLKENHKLCRTLMTHIPNINELIVSSLSRPSLTMILKMSQNLWKEAIIFQSSILRKFTSLPLLPFWHSG